MFVEQEEVPHNNSLLDHMSFEALGNASMGAPDAVVDTSNRRAEAAAPGHCKDQTKRQEAVPIAVCCTDHHGKQVEALGS